MATNKWQFKWVLNNEYFHSKEVSDGDEIATFSKLKLSLKLVRVLCDKNYYNIDILICNLKVFKDSSFIHWLQEESIAELLQKLTRPDLGKLLINKWLFLF